MDARTFAWEKLKEITLRRNMLLVPRENEIAKALREEGIAIAPGTIRIYINKWIAEGLLTRVGYGAVGMPNKEK